jgi:VWFA-related protein
LNAIVRSTALGLLVAAPTAVQSPPPRAVFESRLNLVYVTVTVHDPAGRVVPDLPVSAFEVREDGQPRPISVFSRAGDSSADDHLALDVALLLDTSGSMSQDMRTAHKAALAVLDRVPRLRRRTIISFDNDIRFWHADGAPNVLLADMLAARTVGGATALHSALVAGIDALARDSSGRAAVLVLTDGRDWGSPVSEAQLRRAIDAANVAIYPLPFGGANFPVTEERLRPRAFLERIAEESGGLVLLPEAGGFERALDRLVQELASQYVLGFAPATATLGRSHRLEVRLADRRLKVRHRERYLSR